MTTFNKFDNTAEQQAAHYADNMEKADLMVGSEVYIESVNGNIQINATLESNGDGYYYINNTVLRMNFLAKDIETAMAMQSGNIIRINTENF